MKLNSIEINNFHCFSDATFEFGEKTTVFIGHNGTGKTSVLNALQKSLSLFFMPNIWNDEGSFIGPDINTRPSRISPWDIYRDNLTNKKEAKSSIYCVASTDQEGEDSKMIKWGQSCVVGQKNTTTHSDNQDAYLALLEACNKENSYPVFACYSDRYPNIEEYTNKRRFGIPSKVETLLSTQEKIDPRFGYWLWNGEPTATPFWRKRYYNMFNSIIPIQYQILKAEEAGRPIDPVSKKNVDDGLNQLHFVQDRLVRFTTKDKPEISFEDGEWSIKDLGFDGIGEPCIYLENSNDKKYWNELPAGYERLLNIVFDIAYRSLLLNGPDKEVRGVVIIDEVDLHLHPSLQRDVLQRFRLAFPEVQFIVTTHSPIVVSHFPELDGNKVIQLEHVDGVYHHYDIPHWYGMDYLTTLQMVMQTDPNSNYLRDLKDRYIRFKRRGKEDFAQEVLGIIRDLVQDEDRMNSIITELNHRLEEE